MRLVSEKSHADLAKDLRFHFGVTWTEKSQFEDLNLKCLLFVERIAVCKVNCTKILEDEKEYGAKSNFLDSVFLVRMPNNLTGSGVPKMVPGFDGFWQVPGSRDCVPQVWKFAVVLKVSEVPGFDGFWRFGKWLRFRRFWSSGVWWVLTVSKVSGFDGVPTVPGPRAAEDMWDQVLAILGLAQCGCCADSELWICVKRNYKTSLLLGIPPTFFWGGKLRCNDWKNFLLFPKSCAVFALKCLSWVPKECKRL